MLANHKEYYKMFIKDLISGDPTTRILAELILPEELSEAITSSLTLDQREILHVREEEKSFSFEIRNEGCNSSTIYKIFINDQYENKCISEFNYKFNCRKCSIEVSISDEPGMVTFYNLNYTRVKNDTPNVPHTYNIYWFGFTKKTSNGVYAIKIKKLSEKNSSCVVQEYFYGKDSLKSIGKAYLNPWLLFDAEKYGIVSDISSDEIAIPTLEEVFQFFQKRQEELLGKENSQLTIRKH